MGDWVEVKAITDNSEEATQWRQAMGAKNFTSLLKTKNAYTLLGDLDFVNGFASTPDDVTKLTLSAIKDVVVNASWKMVYAKTDTEFESQWEKMMKDCKDLGAEDIVKWRLEDLANALKIKNSLVAK
jgi:putative aldouronate transport system substrate-binding protein